MGVQQVRDATGVKFTHEQAVHAESGGYLSTGCLHGRHDYCQCDTGAAGTKIPGQCKFCALPCRCACHQERTHEGEHQDPV